MENITYQVECIASSGKVYDLSPVLIGLQWEEQTNELAQRLTVSVANMAMEGTWLMALVEIGCPMSVSANWGDGNQQVFSGQIWEWTYSSSQQKEISLTAYDPLKSIQQSYDYGYYSSGMDSVSILNQICSTWEIPLSYLWSSKVTHEKLLFNNLSISDMILEVLEEIKDKCGGNYVCHWKNDSLTVNSYGSNQNTYIFGEHCTMSTHHKISIHDLVTRVKVIGNADDDGRYPVEAVVDGDQSFGVLQKIIVRDTDKTVSDAIAEAETYLEKHQKPEETINLTTVDLPFLRKGDVVSVSAGDLMGDFYILGVSHNATKRTMELTLESKE